MKEKSENLKRADLLLMEIQKRVGQSAPNKSNETYIFMCLGRAGRFGQC